MDSEDERAAQSARTFIPEFAFPPTPQSEAQAANLVQNLGNNNRLAPNIQAFQGHSEPWTGTASQFLSNQTDAPNNVNVYGNAWYPNQPVRRSPGFTSIDYTDIEEPPPSDSRVSTLKHSYPFEQH
jgi:hypothetical protein